MKHIMSMAYQLNPERIKILFMVTLMVLTVVHPAMAADPWESANTTFSSWMDGSLGALLALIVFIVGIVIAIAQKSLNILGWAIVMAFVIGGAGGIADSFFDLGQTAFGTSP